MLGLPDHEGIIEKSQCLQGRVASYCATGVLKCWDPQLSRHIKKADLGRCGR